MTSGACFLVPTKSTDSPRATMSTTALYARRNSLTVCCRSMMWMPLRAPKMYGFIFGFQRLVWWPKCTPASSSCLIVTSLIRALSCALLHDTRVPRQRSTLRDLRRSGPRKHACIPNPRDAAQHCHFARERRRSPRDLRVASACFASRSAVVAAGEEVARCLRCSGELAGLVRDGDRRVRRATIGTCTLLFALRHL